jgi:hypothetical protein
MAASDLPRTDSGSVDWERAFEDPDEGFIPLILRAETAAELRESAIGVVERLHSRQDDPLEMEQFIEQLNQLIPDTTSDEMLHHLSAAVTSLLRQMKMHRLQAAHEHAALRRKARQADRRRRVIEAAENGRKWRTIAIGSTTAALLIAGVVTYEILSQPGDSPADKLADALLDQMRQAAKSGTTTGAARMDTMAGRQAITVSGLSQEACFGTAWGLVNQGTILINGLGSPRLSPTIIRDLCAQAGDRASVTWMPK